MKLEENMLDKLWSGDIFARETLFNTENAEINNLSSNLDALHFELSEKLDAKLLNKLNSYERAHGAHTELVSREAFKLGFSLAVKIMSEAYQK